MAALANDFWSWRAATQPVSSDDIPRLERPVDWAAVDWSAEAVDIQRQQLASFEARWQVAGRDAAEWPVFAQVDHRLIGCALARVRWELDVLRGWERNPYFYVQQTLGALFEQLLQPPPFDASRSRALVRRASTIPATLASARANLSDAAARPYAVLAVNALADVGVRLETVVRELAPLLTPGSAEPFAMAIREAVDALEAFRDWVRDGMQHWPTETAVGREAYVWFLHHVALIPSEPEQIIAAGRQELERAVVFEALERHRNQRSAALSLPLTQAEWSTRQAQGERMLRQFCAEHDLLTLPGWLHRYRTLPLPEYLAPLRGLGVTDDLTSPTRLDQDGVCYIPEPSADLPYFYLAMAQDPRTLIAHEGMHYYQLAQSWAHLDPIRRHYYDSGPNEGIGFYAEEMLLQAGLFEDSPRSREIIYNFMRLRALRVEVDVRLALGELSIETAAAELAQRVPMDPATAYEEASFFASSPGQAITYQIGKLQILGFLSDTRQALGAAFSLREFHDRLWTNGNVPVALQRWEWLGLRDQIVALDTASDRLPL